MKAIIDCGAHQGSIIRYFQKHPSYGSDFQYYAFECNPVLVDKNYGPSVIAIRKAVWILDGQLKLYMNLNSKMDQGHSVYGDKITGHLDPEHPVTVECIDFSKWLKETFTADDYVVIKMNVEGAEYDVLEKCIADGTINLVNELFIRWHIAKLRSMDRSRHNQLVKDINDIDGLKVSTNYDIIRQRAKYD